MTFASYNSEFSFLVPYHSISFVVTVCVQNQSINFEDSNRAFGIDVCGFGVDGYSFGVDGRGFFAIDLGGFAVGLGGFGTGAGGFELGKTGVVIGWRICAFGET